MGDDPAKDPPEADAGPTDLNRPSYARLERPSLFRPSVNAFMGGRSSTGDGQARASASGLRAQLFNESLARMSQTPAGWKADDTADLVEVRVVGVGP